MTQEFTQATINKIEQDQKLSDALKDINPLLTEERTSLGELLTLFGDRGTAFIIFLIALPAALPVPAVGLSVIIAPPLLFLTIQQILGRRVIWLPQSFKEKTFSTSFLHGVIDKSIPITKMLENFSKPRLQFLTTHAASTIIGVMGFIMSLSVMLPIPLTNTVPSMGIAGMAIGILMRDGLAVIAGAIVGLGWVSMLLIVTIFFGSEAIDIVKGFFHSIG